MRFLATIGALAIVFGIGCAMFFFGGYYSVAGTAEDPAAVTWALTKVRTASVNRHATDSPPARSAMTPWFRPAPRPMPATAAPTATARPA